MKHSVTGCPYDSRKGKIYLNIPFEDKDEAKKWEQDGNRVKKNGIYLIIININLR